MACDLSAAMTEAKLKQQRQTMTSFLVTDILGSSNTESRSRSRDPPSDVTARQQVPADAEMTSSSPQTHNALVNKERAGSDDLRWLQALQEHPTRKSSCIFISHLINYFSFCMAYRPIAAYATFQFLTSPIRPILLDPQNLF